ncbi:MAG: DUF1385 domain-containing protein, partial [candidate division Zixibacteria bacterium]|nr:DUF1385 domain-containing protein [candidate division Zixibacteria bacterium]
MPDLAVGGQAVIEGVMMRSKDKISTAVRLPSGEIVVKTDNYKSKTKMAKVFGWPIIRGVITFVEMLIIGIKTLNFSADIAVREIEKEEAIAEGKEYNEEEKKSNNLILVGTAIFAVALGIGIFFFLPLAISTWFNVDKDAIAFNLVSGLIRVTLFVLYVWVISFFGEFKRVFQYHGAEHKSIYAYENGEELTVENVGRFSTLHPRCGTSFILIV